MIQLLTTSNFACSVYEKCRILLNGKLEGCLKPDILLKGGLGTKCRIDVKNQFYERGG